MNLLILDILVLQGLLLKQYLLSLPHPTRLAQLVLGLLVVVLANACALLPDSVAPEFEHMSHTLQHEPFTNEPTRYGVEIVQVTAEWNLTKRLYIDVSEGVALEPKNGSQQGYGEIWGPREQFTGKIGYKFQIPK